MNHNQNNDDVLANELGKIAFHKGKSDGNLGAKWAAKFLSNNEFEITKDFSMNSVDFLAKANNILKSEGQILLDIESESETPVIGAIIGSGYMNLNPAIVTICINSIYEDNINVTIKGVAKEGLIKQHGGEKAVKKILEKLLL